MAVLSFLTMYALMYAMVNRFDDVYMSLNQVHMAGLIAAPMVAIEMLVMHGMYANAKLNMVLIARTVVVALAMFFFIRANRDW